MIKDQMSTILRNDCFSLKSLDIAASCYDLLGERNRLTMSKSNPLLYSENSTERRSVDSLVISLSYLIDHNEYRLSSFCKHHKVFYTSSHPDISRPIQPNPLIAYGATSV